MASQIQPIVNGNRHSFTSIEFTIAEIYVIGVLMINYSDTLKPGIIRATGPRKAGRTPGIYDATCEFEVYRHEWNHIVRELANQAPGGFGLAKFNISVTYAEGPFNGDPNSESQVVMDVINGCRIVSPSAQNKTGIDASTIRVVVDPMSIDWYGGDAQAFLRLENMGTVKNTVFPPGVGPVQGTD